MDRLLELRKKIDKIDKEMGKLFEKRMKVIKDIAQYKEKKNIEVLDCSREKMMLEGNSKNIKIKELEGFYTKFLKSILGISKEYQNMIFSKKRGKEVKQVTPTPRYALIGKKIDYSYSPIIHSEILKELGIEGSYTLVQVSEEKELLGVLEKVRQGEYIGINVTIPYKSKVIKYLDEISESAKSIGAVNTITFVEGKLVGDNTDYDGIKKTLEDIDIEVRGKKNFVCGSGGAARAVINLLDDLGGVNYLVTRNVEKAKAKFYDHRDLFIINYNELEKIEDKNLIVNCTPCGTYPNIDYSILGDREKADYKGAIDIVYNPEETKFLKGFKTKKNGLLMLVEQAIKSQEIWQGKVVSEKLRKEIYNKVYNIVYHKK